MEEDQTIQAANEAISTIESLVEGRASGAKWLPERARAIISSNTRRVMELLRDGSRPPAERLARAREFAQGGLRSLTDFVSSDSEPIVAAFLRLRDICFNDSSEESDVWRELKVTRTFTLIICRLSSALMPRQARKALGGVVYHVLNRANGRLRLFKKEEDFLAFEHVLQLAHERVPIRILDWCLMSNHWHFVLYPKRDGELTAFMRWLTLTHAQRWKHAHAAVGHGHLYQGRFKSFPIEQDEHLLSVLRYVERNPLRAAGRLGGGKEKMRRMRSNGSRHL